MVRGPTNERGVSESLEDRSAREGHVAEAVQGCTQYVKHAWQDFRQSVLPRREAAIPNQLLRVPWSATGGRVPCTRE